MTTWLDYAIEAIEQPTGPAWATPGELAKAINPATVQTPALDLIDAALVKLTGTPDGRLIITMPPQEGKSTRVAQDFVAWWLTQQPDARIAVASYGASLAVRNGRAIRRRIENYAHLHGLTIANDNGAVHDWTLAGHNGGVLSVGIGGGFTGRPADLLIIDDPIKDRKEADSPTYRQTVWDWWTDVAGPRLGPGAPVVVILTRWHHDDLAGRLLKAEDDENWQILNIPAQADHRPEQGETDALGREPGQFMQSARKRTLRQWERIKVRSGPRTWASLYQGRPTPDEGSLFPREVWQRFDAPQHVTQADGSCRVPMSPGEELVISLDCAFKGTDTSDYVVGVVLLRRGVQVWLLDMVRRRMDFTATLAAVKALAARWPQAHAKFVEDKANGTAVINLLASSVGGLIPVEPDGGKVARAQAIAPFVHAGNVYLPDPALLPNVDELVEEAAAFPAGAHDDAVDALTQGLNRLLINPLFGDPADDWEDEELPYTVSSY